MSINISSQFTVIILNKKYDIDLQILIEKIYSIYPSIHIICVLNEGFAEKKSSHLDILVSDENLGEKRNRAVKASSSQFISFIDSDAEFCDNCLENVYLRFQQNKNLTIIGGPNLPHPNSNKSQWLSYLATLSPMVAGKSRYEKTVCSSKFVSSVPSCNMHIRRSDYIQYLGMNPKLKTGEDLEFCIRVKKNGGLIFFDNKVCVFHHTRELKGFFLQRFTWGYNVISIIKEGGLGNFYYMLFPFICSLIFILLIILSYFKIILILLFIYFLLILSESMRISNKLSESFKLPLYLFIGNMAPALGLWFFIVNRNYNIYKIYNNKIK